MRTFVIGALAAGLALGGCDQGGFSAPSDTKSPGRYAGIGVFDAGPMWEQAKGIAKPADPAEATLADDEHIIVVLDSHSGEIRQCGDHSGHCVAMNPWSGRPVAVPTLPARVEKHASELGDEAVTNSADPQ